MGIVGFTGPRNEVKALNLPISRGGGLPVFRGFRAATVGSPSEFRSQSFRDGKA